MCRGEHIYSPTDIDLLHYGRPEIAPTIRFLLNFNHAHYKKFGYEKNPETIASGFIVMSRILPQHYGADYEARTRYLHLGKVALYQMS